MQYFIYCIPENNLERIKNVDIIIVFELVFEETFIDLILLIFIFRFYLINEIINKI